MLKKIRHSKKRIAATVLACIVAAVTMTSSRDDGNSPGDDPDFDQHPPVAENVFAQMKTNINGAGDNVLIEIKFKPDDRLKESPFLQMMGGDGKPIVMHDDGRNGDARAGDFIFSSFATEDIEEFVNTMENLSKQLEENRNNLVVFESRSGSNVTRDKPFFEREAFLSGQRIEISKDIFSLSATNPDAGVKPVGVRVERKEYCEGEAQRTIGLAPSPLSPSSIARGFGPPPPPICYTIKKEHSLLITDLKVVEDDVRTFNPCTGVGNPNGAWTFKTMMDGLANFGGTGIDTRTFTFYWINNWIVDLTINGELVKNRAQKTIDMIVGPWLDRATGGGIPASSVTIDNWKDLWFSVDEEKLMAYSPFKLTAIVNRGDLRGNGGYTGGGIGRRRPSQGETRFIYSAINILKDKCGKPIGDDCFEGFNVIFEFGNINFDCNFAMQWINLSRPGLLLGSDAYNEELEKITRTVTDPGVAADKPNGSAINQVRTNEIALTNTVDIAFDDRSPRWQFREFKIIQNPGLLDQVPLANQAADRFNGPDGASVADAMILADWVNNNSLGASLPVPPQHLGVDFQAGKANYNSVSQFSAPGYWDGLPGVPGAEIIDDQDRHKFSLNACGDGCHSAETKTTFTHVNAVGLGTQMRYVGVMDYVTDGVDTKTQISPFLTGRTYNFAPNNFADDNVDPGGEDLTDNTLTGFFYVSDPAGRIDGTTGNPYLRGFNDLERRAQDLANFVLVNRCCTQRFSHIIKLSGIAFFRPLNMAH